MVTSALASMLLNMVMTVTKVSTELITYLLLPCYVSNLKKETGLVNRWGYNNIVIVVLLKAKVITNQAIVAKNEGGMRWVIPGF